MIKLLCRVVNKIISNAVTELSQHCGCVLIDGILIIVIVKYAVRLKYISQ